MNHLLWLSVFWGLCTAIVAVVYAVVLAQEDVLPAWYRWLERWRDRGGWRARIAKPLGACEKCFAGQLALWSSSIIVPWSWEPIAIVIHVVAACSAVLFAATISHLYKWLMRQL